MSVTQGYAMPTRYVLPDEASPNDGVIREFVDWSLYSSFALNAGATIPNIMELFTYLPGQVVAGAGAGALIATRWHTNLEAVRTVGKPDTFTIFQIRINFLPRTYASTEGAPDNDVGAAIAANDQTEDLLKFIESTSFRFSIGEKRYAEASTFDCPCQAGVTGLVASSISSTNAASVFQNRVLVYTGGMSYSFDRARRPVIWNAEPFQFQMFCEWATNPTLTDNKIVQVWLDGVRGRAVQ